VSHGIVPFEPSGLAYAPIGALTAGFLALLAVTGIWSTGAASEGRPAAARTVSDTVTFARGVAPILQASCPNCHQEGALQESGSSLIWMGDGDVGDRRGAAWSGSFGLGSGSAA
jgi:hypothetical protein